MYLYHVGECLYFPARGFVSRRHRESVASKCRREYSPAHATATAVMWWSPPESREFRKDRDSRKVRPSIYFHSLELNFTRLNHKRESVVKIFHDPSAIIGRTWAGCLPSLSCVRVDQCLSWKFYHKLAVKSSSKVANIWTSGLSCISTHEPP